MREVTCDLIDAMAAKPLKEIMPDDEVMALATSAKDELASNHSHVYVDYFFWYAQKPV